MGPVRLLDPESPSRESRLDLLLTLHQQLPRSRGSLRAQTERAIRQLEIELAGGRGTGMKAATR